MMCSDEDLDLVECAIRRLLKQENDPKSDAQAQEASESGAQEENVPESEISIEHADAGEDGIDTRSITLLSRLIEEVHAMRMKKASGQKFDDKPVEQVQKANESTNAADAAVKAAVAAADAAQAAAASVATNSQIIEVLLDTVRIRREEIVHEDEEEDEDDSHSRTKAVKKVPEKRTVFKIVKDLHKQNIWTHVILGFMVITTAYWRFKEISWILRLRKMMSNPLEAVGGIFGGDQQQKYTHKEEVEAKTIQLPKLELPKILQMNENEEKTSP